MTLWCYARDPGGATHLTQVLAMLDRDPLLMKVRVAASGGLRVLARQFAQAILSSKGVGFEPFDEDGVDTLFQDARPDLMLSSTSDIDDRVPHVLWRKARQAGVPVYALVDMNSQVVPRFVDGSGDLFIPDLTMVPDEDACAKLVKAGFPAFQVAVLSCLVERTAPHPTAVETLRAAWAVNNGTPVVLFASECIAEMARHGKPCDYSEFETLSWLLAELRAGRLWPQTPAKVGADGLVVVIRPHPKDDPGKYDHYAGAENGVRVLVSREGNPETAISASHAVAGMRSALLDDAVALKVPVIDLLDHLNISSTG